MGRHSRFAGRLQTIRDDAERELLASTDLDAVDALCVRCLEAGGFCTSCVRSLLPRIAVNWGWLKLIAAAAYVASHPLAVTVSTDPAVARAERREARKVAKAAAAKRARITKLISGQYHRAAPRRAVPLTA